MSAAIYKAQTNQSTSHTLMTSDDTLVSSSVSADALLPHPLLPLLPFDPIMQKRHSTPPICILQVMTGYSVLKAQLTQRIEGRKALSMLRDQELLQMKIRSDHIKAPSMQFTCARKCARAKHGPQCERVKANH